MNAKQLCDAMNAHADALYGKPKSVPRDRAPEGECAYCDRMRRIGSTFHPPHDPSPLCRNAAAGRPSEPHCTCAACF